MLPDLRELLRVAAGRKATPSGVSFDSRTVQSTPESGERAEYDGAKRRKGSKTHIAIDTLRHLPALVVTSTDQQERAQVARLAETVQAVTGETIEIAFVEKGYTGERAAQAAADHAMQLEVVKLPDAKRGFILRSRRWVVERSLAGWLAFVALRVILNAFPIPSKVSIFSLFAILMAHRFILFLALAL